MKKVWIIGASLLFLLLQIACSEQKERNRIFSISQGIYGSAKLERR